MKLKDQAFFFLDLQTTGSKPGDAFILEAAWGAENCQTQSFWVELPREHVIPKRIKIFTGVTELDMISAIPFPEVIARLKKFIENLKLINSICIIHFAQFEKPFLKAAFESLSEEIPFQILCTHDIAKRLLPNLPTRGIKGLAGYFGCDAGELKRSNHHVDATKVIWHGLIEQLSKIGIDEYDQLKCWLSETPRASRTKYEYPLDKEKRLALPDCPGIYRMLNFKGEVLYVGKATSLHSRVNSYFRGQKNRDHKKLEMLTQVVDLAVTTCETPIEAALLETDEIKRLNPRYNISLKSAHRNIIYFDRTFTKIYSNDEANSKYTIGPFSSILPFESMLKLKSYISSEEILLPDPNTFFLELDPLVIKDGLEIFCQRHGLNQKSFASMRSIIAVGLNWYRHLREPDELEQLEELEELVSEKDDDLVEKLTTPEDVADKFERHFMRLGQVYARARKMSHLLNSDISFELFDKRKYFYFVRLGRISKELLDLDSKDSSISIRSVATYDRMSVLLMELDRIRSQGGKYSIKFLT